MCVYCREVYARGSIVLLEFWTRTRQAFPNFNGTFCAKEERRFFGTVLTQTISAICAFSRETRTSLVCRHFGWPLCPFFAVLIKFNKVWLCSGLVQFRPVHVSLHFIRALVVSASPNQNKIKCIRSMKSRILTLLWHWLLTNFDKLTNESFFLFFAHCVLLVTWTQMLRKAFFSTKLGKSSGFS